jgi:hypothetical protein
MVPGGDAGRRAGILEYSHGQYRRLNRSGQRARNTSLRHKPKTIKHLQLGLWSAMAGYGIRF